MNATPLPRGPLNRVLRHALLLAALAGVTLPAAAQFAKPEDAVRYRKGAFQVMGHHFGQIGAMVNAKVPYNPQLAIAHADLVVVMSKLPYVGFVDGTESDDKGGAGSVIWMQRAKFDEAARKMQDATAKLATAARSQNLDTLKAAFGSAAQTCKACHDDFRNP